MPNHDPFHFLELNDSIAWLNHKERIGIDPTLDLCSDAIYGDGIEAAVLDEAVLLAGGAEDGVGRRGLQDGDGVLDGRYKDLGCPGTHFWRCTLINSLYTRTRGS